MTDDDERIGRGAARESFKRNFREFWQLRRARMAALAPTVAPVPAPAVPSPDAPRLVLRLDDAGRASAAASIAKWQRSFVGR